jgi:DNA modification methylase
MKYYQDNDITVYNSNCRDMSELADETIQCVVTSPPYWGLRKYSGNQNNDDWGCAFGLEKTPELYISHSIEILREIRKKLRPDGVVFWNIGDSYNGSGGDHKPDGKNDAGFQGDLYRGTQPRNVNSLKPKDLCLIPFRVTIAAQEDGWWVRSVIIWSKNNPMPESVKDRPTESHEYILLLTKSSKYYWDMEAVRENLDSHYETIAKPDSKRFGGQNVIGNPAIREERLIETNGRNMRSVWQFPTSPYKFAHFATFPEELPERCIKAGTPEYGCCDKCGKPYERIIEQNVISTRKPENGRLAHNEELGNNGQNSLRQGFRELETQTLGWQQACKCADSKPVPSLVLDPFSGSGTTLWVSKKLGRKAVGYELSEQYCELAVNRNRQQALV